MEVFEVYKSQDKETERSQTGGVWPNGMGIEERWELVKISQLSLMSKSLSVFYVLGLKVKKMR